MSELVSQWSISRRGKLIVFQVSVKWDTNVKID